MMPFSPRGARQVREILLLSLGVSIAVAALSFLPSLKRRSSEAMRALVNAAKAETRGVEPRLSGGFAWAPFRKPKVDAVQTNFRLASAIDSTLTDVRGDSSPAARHTTGVAKLLAGRTRDALASLSIAATASSDARIWCDLAAAHYTAAVQYGLPEMFAEALAAADMALTYDAAMAEAQFNRALALESLGLRDDARAAWQRYLSIEDDTEWADEARQHLAGVAPEEDFKTLLEREYDTLVSDDHAAQVLARRYPQEARTWGEARILARWGAALAQGDYTAAEGHLRLARTLGAELVEINGDRMLERGVTAIDDADPARRGVLAAAHVTLSEAHDAFNTNRPAVAETKFRAAASGFESGGSPIALVARYYAANSVYEQGRPVEALQMLESLLQSVSAEFPALRAQALWEVALCHASAARWGAMLDALSESRDIFDRLGESGHASIVRGITAAVYDRTGDDGAAWTNRMVALRGVGRRTNEKLQQMLAGIAQAAMMRQNWRTAASFLNLEIEIGRRVADEYLFAEALLIRAAVRHRLEDAAGARADLAEAGAVIARVEDASIAERLRAEYAAVEAMLASSSAQVVTLASEAIEFEAAKGYRMLLPALYLQRARAYRTAGDPAAAARDLEQGIAELEAHRESLPEGAARWNVFHSADELFEEAIDLALQRNDARAAFAIMERARARALLDSYGRAPSLEQWDVPAGTVIVEYAVLPTKLVVFTAGADGIRATVVPCDRAALGARAGAFVRALAANERARSRSTGMALYKQLIEPVEAQFDGSGTIVFVADGALATIPFGALMDKEGKYLLERNAVVAAPSASIFAAVAGRRRGPAGKQVLIVTNAGGGVLDALPFAGREAEQIARTYPSAVRLDGNDARLENLARESASSAFIHFAGHAMGDPAGLEPASIVLSDGRGGERRVGVRDIAALRLKHTSVVVLAGCATAAGERRSSEGVISVTHGFLAAGAATVIATLWPIDDAEAAVFFPRLHAHLAAGMPPAEALRKVQLETIKDPRAPTALWAAVQVIGS